MFLSVPRALFLHLELETRGFDVRCLRQRRADQRHMAERVLPAPAPNASVFSGPADQDVNGEDMQAP
jgi:hypothetical protein